MAASLSPVLPRWLSDARNWAPQRALLSLGASRNKLGFVKNPYCARITSKSGFRICVRSNLNLDLAPPPIDGDLQETMLEYGAVFSEDGIVKNFQNNIEALDAARNSIAVYDMSHFGRIKLTGDDRIRFLHNQSTANFQVLKEGQGCFTVFISPTGRTIDLAFALVMKNSILLFVSPELTDNIVTMLDKYIFFADKVKVENITDRTSLFLLLGPKTNEVLKEWNLSELIEQPTGYHSTFKLDTFPVTVGVGCGFSENDYFFLSSVENAETIWKKFVESNITPMGDDIWNVLRVLNGRPAPGKELTDEYNPLEAGLWQTISIDKGCYIGQETIARVITYNGVKKQLWGFKCEEKIEPGTHIIIEEKKVGRITSSVYDEQNKEHFALGYIRVDFVEKGKEFDIGGTKAVLTSVPFLTRDLLPK